ncbi:arsenic transporter [Clostridium pasteurianum]|uniref:Na+/H+ antiporter NhaD-like permease n=1 Tax=Clostridium pasteurianum BC1 TaxID=86416 RepID=R4K5J5_CLOPA|nr:arsenic transporter [Clostridium pasteurianum]AGK98427.1 Na+/H+ antiporter NhaD-like permease [Clostridium pasteurianum BC1]
MLNSIAAFNSIWMMFIAQEYRSITMICIFLLTMIVIFIRPKDMKEAYPAAIGAIAVILTGGVSYANIMDINDKIGGASLTIIATIVMSVVLESIGFFRFIAVKLAHLSKGSGYRLYWNIQIFCFLMTLLFNNDGSILITTPILILLLRKMELKSRDQIPYLLSGALIATASSAPIGVSNITNLIALNIVHMTLYMHTAMMFVPCTIGLIFMSVLMFFLLKKKLPNKIPTEIAGLEDEVLKSTIHYSEPPKLPKHTGTGQSNVKENKAKGVKLGRLSFDTDKKRTSFVLKILAFVFSIRCLIFVASYFGIPIQFVAIIASTILLLWRWIYLGIKPGDVLKKTPWDILVFAFSMYVIIYGLHNIGLTDFLARFCEPIIKQHLFAASFMMSGLTSLLSNLFNNHPALMIVTITLTSMNLSLNNLQMIYLVTIIGSDVGSLLLPIGTLASLMWMFILKKNNIKISWMEYLKVTIIVIPATVILTIGLLYLWVQTVFFR